MMQPSVPGNCGKIARRARWHAQHTQHTTHQWAFPAGGGVTSPERWWGDHIFSLFNASFGVRSRPSATRLGRVSCESRPIAARQGRVPCCFRTKSTAITNSTTKPMASNTSMKCRPTFACESHARCVPSNSAAEESMSAAIIAARPLGPWQPAA
eukprot:491891-Alexandrium_andersonii.AAC.1